MTISDIRNSESRLEVKAAAALNLLQPIHRQAFELTLDGILMIDITVFTATLH